MGDSHARQAGKQEPRRADGLLLPQASRLCLGALNLEPLVSRLAAAQMEAQVLAICSVRTDRQ